MLQVNGGLYCHAVPADTQLAVQQLAFQLYYITDVNDKMHANKQTWQGNALETVVSTYLLP